MSALLDGLPSGARIAVIRLRSLGDCVLTTPSLALLKAYRPDLRISVIVEPRFAPVFEDNPDVDEIRESACAADLALNFHGGTRSMILTAATRAKLRCGFAHHRYSFIYSHKIPRAQQILGDERPVHTAEHLASAMFWLGVPRAEIPRARLFAAPAEIAGPYFVIHPFASAEDKTWPSARFLEIAKRARCIFLAGPDDDIRPFARFEVLRNAPLERVKSLISGAQLFLGNDSGPAHVAAAFGVPVVVLFGASHPATWAPWRTEAQVLTSRAGIGGISVDEVLAAIESLKVRA
ncbi:MAG TPA: glycosyltransferase family 9 protein [Bryobacteraceae bacterium]|nr:glycosyltransferase family 9 protein [Bryobacteraceae bacterium]